METLAHDDVLALNRAIGEIYTARDMESFYRSVFASIQGIIPGELCSFNDFNLHPTRFLKGAQASQDHSLAYGKLLPIFNAHFHTHPMATHYFSENVVTTTDYASRRHFKSTAIYNEYYRHLDVETQIGFSIPLSQEKASLFVLSRKIPDFSERDRLLLTLLKPHMISALRNATEFGLMKLENDVLQRGAAAEGHGAVLIQSDGMILCISPFAKEMLAKYFDATLMEGGMLPGKLIAWFKIETAHTQPPLKKRDSNEFPRRVERTLFIVEKDDKCLKIRLLNDFITGDYVLVITEKGPSLILQNPQAYGLSCREAEVLHWISKGKTNMEIAIILGIRKRTADKHLENILTKLGVETRTAAAAMMQ